LQPAFDRPPAPAGGVLAGRQSIAIMELEGLGPIAVKHFARGGMIRHVNRHFYCQWPRSRGENEFRWLETARRVGIAAPRPIAFATRGRIIGQCWLIMSALTGHRSLIQATQDGSLDGAACKQVADQIRILMAHGIWHRDLHPGNILVDQKNRPCIIDFDKACYLRDRRMLRKRYHRRWNRAIVKHGLPGELAQIMTLVDADP
jgi:RIO-like serine/threonine protein kinase